METVWIAEAFGLGAIIFNIFGYRSNDMRRYLVLSGGAMLCLSTHFFLLVFLSINIGFFLFEWFVLQHGYLIILAYTSSIIFTAGSILFTDTAVMRRWFVFAETIGLIYAFMVGSVFGSIFNSVNLISIIIKMRSTKKPPSQN